MSKRYPTKFDIVRVHLSLAISVLMELMTKRWLMQAFLHNLNAVRGPNGFLKDAVFSKATGEQADGPSLQADISVLMWLFHRTLAATARAPEEIKGYILATRSFPSILLVGNFYGLLFSIWCRGDANYLKPFREFVLRLAVVYFHELAFLRYEAISRMSRIAAQRRREENIMYVTGEGSASALALNADDIFGINDEVRDRVLAKQQRRRIWESTHKATSPREDIAGHN